MTLITGRIVNLFPEPGLWVADSFGSSVSSLLDIVATFVLQEPEETTNWEAIPSSSHPASLRDEGLEKLAAGSDLRLCTE